MRLAAETNGRRSSFNENTLPLYSAYATPTPSWRLPCCVCDSNRDIHDRPLALWRKIRVKTSAIVSVISRDSRPRPCYRHPTKSSRPPPKTSSPPPAWARGAIVYGALALAPPAPSTVVLNPSLEEPLAAGSSAANASVPTSASPDADRTRLKSHSSSPPSYRRRSP